MTPLAVTGAGVVSPVAIGWEGWRAALAEPDEASRAAFGGTPTAVDTDKVGPAHVAEVWGFDATAYLGKKGLRNFDRLTRFLIVAAKHALEDAGIKRDGEYLALDPTRVGICSSTAYGSLDAITELNLVAELEDPRYINPARFPNTVINAAAGYVSIWEDLRAPNVTVVDGNCGALDAVLAGETHLLHRRSDAFLVGGGDVLSDALYLAFKKLGAVAEPSHEARLLSGPGLQLGEGAAYLVAERLDDARSRDARLRGILAGYATAFEPPTSDAALVHASSDSVKRAIGGALVDAHLEPNDVDAVVSAQSGLKLIDDAELEGIRSALGSGVAVAAPKRIFGETFGGAGALGMTLALAWFAGAKVAPLVQGAPPRACRTAIVLTVGFYGNVSAVVLRVP